MSESGEYGDGTQRIEDHNCPSCGGDLQRQDRINIECADCDQGFANHRNETTGTEKLITPNDEVVLHV